VTVEWLSTAPNPHPRGGRYHTCEADDGQRGWRLHAVPVQPGQELRALCGLVARYGWGVDLFIERRCKRCVARLPGGAR
jgi:hypothetical protein